MKGGFRLHGRDGEMEVGKIIDADTSWGSHTYMQNGLGGISYVRSRLLWCTGMQKVRALGL